LWALLWKERIKLRLLVESLSLASVVVFCVVNDDDDDDDHDHDHDDD
jgi:hypothetical protein